MEFKRHAVQKAPCSLHSSRIETLDRRAAPEARQHKVAGFARWPGDDHHVNCR
jgi:hypothetical protein